MFNILVANEDQAQRESYCVYLNNDNKLNITSVDSGLSALTAYNEINPNAFILDTKFTDMSTAQIIDKLSATKKESKICNIVLTADVLDCIFPISNTEKIYRILFKPLEQIELKSTIDDICVSNQIEEIDELELRLFLLDLKFNINSISTKYLIEAIYQCYYYPYLLGNLNDIISIIAYKFNVTEKNVKAAFRNALKPINTYRNTIKTSSFINLFDDLRNITPKYFLEVITTYLHKKNRGQL